ncbi:MAG: GntR family transcriptional regulator [Spirochaetales bacterium]|nr:GntR family transcriptional regulator [Candidatus Physcosoma equi]
MEAGKVFVELEKQILDLTLRPGTELNLNNLASLFGVSRSPIRDAIRELSSQHLVDIYPQRGTYVSKINLKRADDERFIRLNLELGAIEKFMDKKTQEDIDAMKALLDEQAKAFALRDTAVLLKLDDEFHKVIFKAAGREEVFNFIQSNNGNYHRMRVISFMFDNIADDVLEQHSALISAIEKDDKESLKELDRKHISKLLYETDSFRESMPQYFVES